LAAMSCRSRHRCLQGCPERSAGLNHHRCCDTPRTWGRGQYDGQSLYAATRQDQIAAHRDVPDSSERRETGAGRDNQGNLLARRSTGDSGRPHVVLPAEQGHRGGVCTGRHSADRACPQAGLPYAHSDSQDDATSLSPRGYRCGGSRRHVLAYARLLSVRGSSAACE